MGSTVPWNVEGRQQDEPKKQEVGFHQQLAEWVERNDEFFGHFLDVIDDKLDIGRWPSFLIFVATIVSILLIGDSSAKWLSFVLCCAYPLERSQQLILGLIDSEKDNFDYWLIYWVIFAMVTSYDYLFYTTQGYWLVKSASFVYLYFPVTNGLEQFVEPVLKPIVFIAAGNFDREVLSKAHPALLKLLHIDFIMQLENDVQGMLQGMVDQKSSNNAMSDISAGEHLSTNAVELSKLIDQCKRIVLDPKNDKKVAQPCSPSGRTNTSMAPPQTVSSSSSITLGDLSRRPSQEIEAAGQGNAAPKLDATRLDVILKQLLNPRLNAQEKTECKTPVEVFQAMLDKQAEPSKEQKETTTNPLNVEAILNRIVGSHGKQLQTEASNTLRRRKISDKDKQFKKDKDKANDKTDKSA